MGRLTELLEKTPAEIIEELERLAEATDSGGVEVIKTMGENGRLKKISVLSEPNNLMAELFAGAAIREMANDS